MNKPRVWQWAGALGVVASILLIVTFPLYLQFIRVFVERLREAGKASIGSLTLKDKVALYLNYELDKRLGGLFVGLYRLTGGRITRLWKVDVLILTTRGRRTGKIRAVLLQFFRDGTNMVMVAANSGRPSHPGWFYDVKATPAARVQIMDRILQVRAEELSTDETTALWPRVLRLVPIEQTRELTIPGGEVLHGRKELSFTA
jgi:deazaflavin-dependent oxidoreductase (nitroreductase family)